MWVCVQGVCVGGCRCVCWGCRVCVCVCRVCVGGVQGVCVGGAGCVCVCGAFLANASDQMTI